MVRFAILLAAAVAAPGQLPREQLPLAGGRGAAIAQAAATGQPTRAAGLEAASAQAAAAGQLPRAGGRGAASGQAAATGQHPEEQPVLAAVQRFFDVLTARDASAGRDLVLPEGSYFTIRADGNSSGGALLDLVEKLPGGAGRLLERMYKPVVHLRGGLAVVWTAYDFHRDGEFSHCGIDAFTLVKKPGGWKIASLAYTVEPGACAELDIVRRPL